MGSARGDSRVELGMVIDGVSPAQRGRGASVHACREPIHRFVSPNSRDLARRQSKTRPDDSGRGKPGGSRHVGDFGAEEIPGVFSEQPAIFALNWLWDTS